MKKFITAMLASIFISMSILAFATNYDAITANFKIIINGNEWTSDEPIVTINGNTYLPVKSLEDALGVTIVWNEEKSQVEIETAVEAYANKRET
jgi:hypothetical protein